MADDFVQAGTHAFRIAVIVQRTRVSTSANCFFVDEHVDVVGGHSRPNNFARHAQDVGGHVARVSHALDDLGRLDSWLIPARHVARLGVGRLLDALGDRTHRADNARNHAPFERLVATLVLTAAPAPARIAGSRQHFRRGRDAHTPKRLRAISGGALKIEVCRALLPQPHIGGVNHRDTLRGRKRP